MRVRGCQGAERGRLTVRGATSTHRVAVHRRPVVLFVLGRCVCCVVCVCVCLRVCVCVMTVWVGVGESEHVLASERCG